MPDTMPSDANFQALQDNLSNMQIPHTQRVGLQGAIIDAIPLAISAFADDNGHTTAIVEGILDRKKRQDQMAFANELDLRRLQLDTAFKGIQNERDKVESMYRNTLTQEQTTGVQQANQQSKVMFPIKKEQELAQTSEINARQQETIQKTKEQKQKSEQYFSALDRLEHGDVTDKAIAEHVKLTGSYPAHGDSESLGKAILTISPRAVVLKEKIDHGEATEANYQEYQALIETAADPAKANLLPVVSKIYQTYYSISKAKGRVDDNGYLKQSGDRKQVKNVILQQFGPHYDNIIALGNKQHQALQEEFQGFANILNDGTTGAQIESEVKKAATDWKTGAGQTKFLEKQLGDVINPDAELKSLQGLSEAQDKEQEDQRLARQTKQEEEIQQANQEAMKAALKQKLGIERYKQFEHIEK